MAEERLFSIAQDAASNIWRARLWSMWREGDVESYAAALRRLADAPAAGGDRTKLLVDASALPVQSRDIAEAIQAALAALDPLRRQDRLRIAMVRPASMLSTLQARRASSEEATRAMKLFSDAQEAEDWLRSA